MLESLFKTLPPVKVINADGKYVPLDLSVRNQKIPKTETSRELERFIDTYLTDNKAVAAYGGYNEQRDIYKRSGLFNDGSKEERDIHIGIDIWIKAGTPVLAALDGEVHSFDYNAGVGNYGPTIILKHQIDNNEFYTLYGHLAIESIEDIEIGDTYKQGEEFAVLGDSSVNGDYAPHLHFQIIKDIEDHFGDYPGVCSTSDLEFYLQNCPDPNLLLKLK